MARPATGKVIETPGKDGKTYRGLRFTAYGKRRYETLGTATAEEAERKLAHVLADVERGLWKPARGEVEPPAEPTPIPTFHAFVEGWWQRKKPELAAKTVTDYEWRLEVHLIPYFGRIPLNEITFDTVERYKAGKLAEGKRIREAAAKGKTLTEERTDRLGRRSIRPQQALGPRAINMTLVLLAQILETAVERDLIPRNPAKGKPRRVPQSKPDPVFLERPSQIEALLIAAGELDREATRERAHLEREAINATFMFSGLSIAELCDLRWRHVDLANGWLQVPGTKTENRPRKVKIRGGLRNQLLVVRDRHADAPQTAHVFPTRTGRRQTETKLREGPFGLAVKRANRNLEAKGQPPLPEGLHPHSLRHTFASMLYAVGEPPPVVMAEMGHGSEGVALRIYAHVMRLSDTEKKHLAALLNGEVLAISGNRGARTLDEQNAALAA